LETVSRACALLREFTDDGQALSLVEIMKRTGMERTICFRLLRTLESEGFLRKADHLKYASNLRILTGKRYRIGYASERSDSFTTAVSQGLRWAARERQLDLIEFENNYSPKAALHNAELLVKEQVDFAIEFQAYDRIAAKVSNLFQEAGIPVIALEIPQPGATFFGVDNYKAGQLAGRLLLKAAQAEWNGEFDEVILQDLEIAGAVPRLRLSGIQAVLSSGDKRGWVTTHLDSRGDFVRSFEMTRKHLQIVPKRRTLLAGVNDYAVLGALRAFDESGRSGLCRAVGMGGVPEARRELRMAGTRLAGTVGFFPEQYGDRVLAVAFEILQHKVAPSVNYMPVQLITPQNLSHFYPKEIFEQSDIIQTSF
jgi:ribose transport system substrate-binding protein